MTKEDIFTTDKLNIISTEKYEIEKEIEKVSQPKKNTCKDLEVNNNKEIYILKSIESREN